jgi:hypothetical protein
MVRISCVWNLIPVAVVSDWNLVQTFSIKTQKQATLTITIEALRRNSITCFILLMFIKPMFYRLLHYNMFYIPMIFLFETFPFTLSIFLSFLFFFLFTLSDNFLLVFISYLQEYNKRAVIVSRLALSEI